MRAILDFCLCSASSDHHRAVGGAGLSPFPAARLGCAVPVRFSRHEAYREPAAPERGARRRQGQDQEAEAGAVSTSSHSDPFQMLPWHTSSPFETNSSFFQMFFLVTAPHEGYFYNTGFVDPWDKSHISCVFVSVCIHNDVLT